MNDNGSNSKLDWMYKGANSLVDREEYLLGRSVDKSLEQLNSEEKEKKLGIVPPKNHVEHECIPPSIRDFNKIVQAEQVDISAKLQEDPLVAIKKREEEARRQFLQNPVQLKKLQEALKAQELKKKKIKHKKLREGSDSDLDSKIAKKLKYLKGDPLGISGVKKKKKKSKDDSLDTILMHKFNQLKDLLSQDDLNDILAGNVSDTDEESGKQEKKNKTRKDSSDEESDGKQKLKKRERKKRSSSSERHSKKVIKKRKDRSSSCSSNNSDDYKRSRKEEKRKRNIKVSRENRKRKDSSRRKRNRSSSSSSSEDISEEESEAVDKKYTSKSTDNRGIKRDGNKKKNEVDKNWNVNTAVDDDLENRILQKLRLLRESSKSKRSESDSDNETSVVHKNNKNSSDSSPEDSKSHRYDSDSDETVSKPRTFGLVKADGTKIALNKKVSETKKSDKPTKVETVTKPDRKNVKRLTEEEKEQMRREMMKNAEKRDKERSDNLKKYREEDKHEEKSAANFDKDFLHKQLSRSTKEATVESRIKSNLNNIQRSSRHMDTHFSRR